MYKLLVTGVASMFLLTACLDSDSDSKGDGKTVNPIAEFIIKNTVENEYVDNTSPSHQAGDVAIDTDLVVTMNVGFPNPLTVLSAEVYGFPSNQNCIIQADGFRCDGAYPLVFDDSDGQTANAWHSEGISSISREEATYEILFTTLAANEAEHTATFSIKGGIDLKPGMTYAVHLFGGQVQYIGDSEGDLTDFASYWTFSTAAATE